MSPSPVMVSSIPDLSGDPGALSGAAEVLSGLGPKINTATDSVVQAWKGVDTEAYDAPEAPAARQSIPKIDAPMKTISANLESVGSTLSTAATTIKTLQERRTRLIARVSSYNSLVGLYEPDEDTGNAEARELTNKRADLVADIRLLTSDIDAHKSEVASSLAAIKAPDPKLPEGTITAGEAGGNYGDVHGPNAEASAMSESYTDEEGAYHAGAGAMAQAQLFGAEAGGEWNTAYGDYTAGASVDVGAQAEAHAAMQASLLTGFQGEVGASASFGARGNANASAEYGLLHGNASGEAFVGGELEGKAGLNVGYDGISANANVSAFLGGRIEGEAEVGISGASVKGGLEGRAGIGFEASGDVSIGLNETKVKFNVGGAIGLGGGFSVDVTIKPKEIVKDVADLLGFDSDAAMKTANQVVGQAADAVVDKAGDFLDSAGSTLGKLNPF